MMPVKIEVVINARSGTDDKKDVQGRLEKAFEAHGIEARIWFARSGNKVVDLARQAASSDADVIVAGGGDGTISSIAAAAIESGKTMGVLPFGTMNHFAKDVRIPLDLDGAIQTIVAGHVVGVDVGEVNGRIFVNNSSLGLYPSIVEERKKQQRLGWGKWPAYVWAGLAVLRRYPFLNVRLSIDGKELSSRTPFVFIGNNEYEMETLNIGGRTCLDAGALSLYMSDRVGRLGLIRLALRALFGGLSQEKDFIALCTKEIWIGTRHKHVRVAVDGEVLVMEPPLHYRVRPQALRVLTAKNDETS